MNLRSESAMVLLDEVIAILANALDGEDLDSIGSMDAACPQCYPGDFPAVAPQGEPVTEPDGSLRASYACPACGYEWVCWWDSGATGWPRRDAPAPLAETRGAA